jgi:Uma2 family endonuclease
MTAAPARHQFTVDDLQQLVAAGVIDDDDRVELIEGDLIDMSPINEPHAQTVDTLNELLMPAVRRDARVRVQNPVRLSDLTMVEPDIAIVRRQQYRTSHPRPDDVLLLIEVADTTLSFDLTTKASLYARAGVPELWVADANARIVHRHRQPEESTYRLVEQLGLGDTITIDALPNVSLNVSDIFA